MRRLAGTTRAYNMQRPARPFAAVICDMYSRSCVLRGPRVNTLVFHSCFSSCARRSRTTPPACFRAQKRVCTCVWGGVRGFNYFFFPAILPRSSCRPTCATTRPPTQTTLTYLYLLLRPVLRALTLTVVISQTCLYLH
jgi:hypothetical protein